MTDETAVDVDPRVHFAAERTLLAWLRTSVAMMGFGFVVARFGLLLEEMSALREDRVVIRHHGWSLWIGVALVAIGVVVNLAAAVTYQRFFRRTVRAQPHVPNTWPLAVTATGMIGLIGAVLAVYLLITGPRLYQ